jgi:hypothetical protein
MKDLGLLACEWRYSPAAGSAGFARKSFGHVACPSCQPSPALSRQTAKLSCISASRVIEGTVITFAAAPRLDQLGRSRVRRHTRALSASITRARIWREVLKFVRLPLPLLPVGRSRFFDRNVWPGKLCHLRIPSLLMRARAQATVRIWKKRLEHQAHARCDIRGGCGLPVAAGIAS